MQLVLPRPLLPVLVRCVSCRQVPGVLFQEPLGRYQVRGFPAPLGLDLRLAALERVIRLTKRSFIASNYLPIESDALGAKGNHILDVHVRENVPVTRRFFWHD
jgi:hypothetical protein